jgi:GNAT superfamily N-acetyltransferase
MFRNRNSEVLPSLCKGFQVCSPHETTLVAKENDKVIGVCRLLHREEKTVMEAIYVLPEYQRSGIGSLVWREAKKLLDPAKEVVVQVAAYNTYAIEFYERCGFRDTGKRWDEKKFRLKGGAPIPAIEMILKAAGTALLGRSKESEYGLARWRSRSRAAVANEAWAAAKAGAH